MQDSFRDSNAEHSVMNLVVDQLEELVVTLIEEVRQRPGVAAALLAAVVGALVGSLFASGVGRRKPPAVRAAAQRARGASEAFDLAGLGVKLFQNPIVRGYVLSAIEKQIRNRMSR